MEKLTFFLFFLTNGFISCGQTGNVSRGCFTNIGYNISVPDKVYPIPPTLYEISGITEINPSTLACVQDEHGIIFMFDLNKGQVIRQFLFASEGDYEDIARVDNKLYVSRSDGAINEITDFELAGFKRASYKAEIAGNDIEGMCYDRRNNRLLIAPKEFSGIDSIKKNDRYIYSFDLTSKKVSNEPALLIDLKKVKRFALEKRIRVPMKDKKKGKTEEPDIRFRISAIGIHPLTNRLFVISSAEPMLFVFDMKGNIECMEWLNSEMFPQPEGIAFMKNGDMFISNEGLKGSPTIVRFNYRPAKF